MSLVWKPMFPSQSDKLHNNGGEVSEKVTLSDEELYEAVKRFCRTEKAAHNLMELIKAYGDSCRFDELENLSGKDMRIYKNPLVNQRLAELQPQSPVKEDK